MNGRMELEIKVMNQEITSSIKINAKLTNLMTSALKVLAPELGKKLAKTALLTPKRIQSKWPSHVKQFHTMTRYGKVRTYKYGEGKSIWFVHGWSSCAFSFWPLMQQLAEKGYSCISFDFPAHGLSQGKQSSLPQMIRVFEDISATLLDPSMVITHAMGASVIANSHWFKQCKSDLLLVSPVFNSYELLQKLVTNSGLDQELFDQVIHDIYKSDKLFMPDLNSIPKYKEFTGKLKIMHDKQDGLAPFSMSKHLSQQSEAKLITANKLGHNKILRSKSILNVIESYSTIPSTSFNSPVG